MSWKKYFKPVNQSVISGSDNNNTSVSNYNSWLPQVYEGPSDRLQRYQVYETMDMDHEIHAALDTIADFSTEYDDTNRTPFIFDFHDEASSHEVSILSKTLRQWCTLNEFEKRLWNMFRMTLKYADQFFIRDPETYKWYWVDPNKVTKVLVNESKGKKIEVYYIKDLDLNLRDSVASSDVQTGDNNNSLIYAAPHYGQRGQSANLSGAPSSHSANTSEQETPVDAKHVVQLTLCDGMSPYWPFGTSILEQVHKVYKQKELLEDSIIIYRVHRAPERRVFMIDTGQMPPNKAQQYLERIKLEIQQKRIPSRDGGGNSITDSTMNPMSMLEDYFFSVSSDGRGSKVETLPGGEGINSIDDLRYFNNKMLRALGVPSSYLPTGPEDGTASYNDGRVGTAFIQEFRFSKVCQRYQKQIAKVIDKEFKLYLKKKGVTIDNSMFTLKFPEPQSFSEYRRLELDAAKINVFNSMSAVPYISKRFALTRYLGLSQQEIQENEKLWKEENLSSSESKSTDKQDLSSVGVTPSGIDGIPNVDEFDDIGDEFDDVDNDFDAGEDDIDDLVDDSPDTDIE